MTQFLAFSGSNRKDSLNQKVVDCIVSALKENGRSVTETLLQAQPVYNGDDERNDGQPEETRRFRQLLSGHDAFVIGCPEYNGFMTPLLLNAIDWATRSPEAAPDLSCFAGKTVLIVSASPGPGGGMRSSTHLKTMLSGIGSVIFPGTFAVRSASNAFDEAGKLVDESVRQNAERVAERFAVFAEKLAG